MGKCLFMNFMDLVIVFKICKILYNVFIILYYILYVLFVFLFVFFIDFFGIGLFVLWYDKVDF